MKLTTEQKTIVEQNLGPDDIMKVIAFAGTGKTTTLVAYAAARPHMRFLYIAFNKGVQLEASKKFGPNVVCKTSHALGFRKVGVRHKHRLCDGFKAYIVREALNLEKYEDAQFTIDTLQNYLISADAKVSKRHISYQAKIHYSQTQKKMPDFIGLANQLGRLMCDASNPAIGMTHDGYLKLFQLSNPKLDYDCILLDEAQDINPVTAAFVLNQENISKILVGDPNQQIYSFRGARNSMAHIDADQTYYLTASFRFNKNVARVANMVLDHFKGEKKKIVGLKARPGKYISGQKTIISRTNARIFDEAVSQISKGKKVSFVGGIGGYRFDKILDCYFSYVNLKQNIEDPYIKSFASFATMNSYADAVEDRELISMCKVVLKHRHNIVIQVKKIKSANVDPDQADILLTTAHKAKGLEWAHVTITDDFPSLIKDGKIIERDGLDPDEFNLIYVSMTRAMDHLKFDKESSIIEFIRKYQRTPK